MFLLLDVSDSGIKLTVTFKSYDHTINHYLFLYLKIFCPVEKSIIYAYDNANMPKKKMCYIAREIGNNVAIRTITKNVNQ